MPRDLTYGHVDTDGTMAGNSDKKVASQKATKAYVDTVAAGYEPSLTKGRIIGASGLTASSNSGTVIGGDVTLSMETLGRIVGSDPLTASNNSGTVIGGDVTVSIATLGRVIGEANQITISSNSGSVIGGNLTVSLETTVSVQAIAATNRITIPFGTVSTQTSSGVTGTIQYDNENIYICTATDIWAKASTTTSW